MNPRDQVYDKFSHKKVLVIIVQHSRVLYRVGRIRPFFIFDYNLIQRVIDFAIISTSRSAPSKRKPNREIVYIMRKREHNPKENRRQKKKKRKKKEEIHTRALKERG